MKTEIVEKLVGLFWEGLQDYTSDIWFDSSTKEKEELLWWALSRIDAPINESEALEIFWQWADGLEEDSFTRVSFDIPDKLYHATYKQFLDSIKNKGLGNTNNKMWTDSKSGVVYLAKDPFEAESYAEEAEWLDDKENQDEYLENIIILEIDTNKLNFANIYRDENLLPGGEETYGFEYHGIIPWEACKIFESTISEEFKIYETLWLNEWVDANGNKLTNTNKTNKSQNTNTSKDVEIEYVYIWDIYIDPRDKGTWLSAEKNRAGYYEGSIFGSPEEAKNAAIAHLAELEEEGELLGYPEDYSVDIIQADVSEVEDYTLAWYRL